MKLPKSVARVAGRILPGSKDEMREVINILNKILLKIKNSAADGTSAAAPNLFVPPGHFYSPITNDEEALNALKSAAVKRNLDSLCDIRIDKNRMTEVWRTLTPYLTNHAFNDSENNRLRYKFDNPAYAWGDGLILQAMLRNFQPKRIVEVGSGWSSACIIDTLEKYHPNDCSVTFIEPYPDLLQSLVVDTSIKTRLYAQPIQHTSLSIFEELEASDVLFIDSTHVLRTGSDVCFELFEVMPRLKSGVLVHFHDIFWPFEYPSSWVMDEKRSWNELYALRAFLSGNDGWEIVFFNDYFVSTCRETIENTCADFLRNSGGALWLRKL